MIDHRDPFLFAQEKKETDPKSHKADRNRRNCIYVGKMIDQFARFSDIKAVQRLQNFPMFDDISGIFRLEWQNDTVIFSKIFASGAGMVFLEQGKRIGNRFPFTDRDAVHIKFLLIENLLTEIFCKVGQINT